MLTEKEKKKTTLKIMLQLLDRTASLSGEG